MRELAAFDPDVAQRVMRWPIREGLLRYVYLMKERARRAYETDLMVWAMLAPHQKKQMQPPRVPEILRTG